MLEMTREQFDALPIYEGPDKAESGKNYRIVNENFPANYIIICRKKDKPPFEIELSLEVVDIT